MNLDDLAAVVSDASGITIRPEHHRALELAARTAGSLDVTRVVDEFTVKETWFFREHEALAEIPWHALLANAHARGEDRIRVWTAACATGEEAYTLAILACEAFGTTSPPVRVHASDISNSALARAEAGRYGKRAMRTVTPAQRARYFSEVDGDAVVGPELRALVELHRHNLTRDPAPPFAETGFDLVLCRNVLIYFSPETTAQVIGALERSLAPNGRLVLGAADTLCGTTSRLAELTPAPVRRPRRPPERRPRPAARLVAAPEDPADLFAGAVSLLERGDPATAVDPLRRALYLDPTFALAAFQLACVYDRIGDTPAAMRLYGQTLRTLDPDDERYTHVMGQVDVGDIAAACRARLGKGTA